MGVNDMHCGDGYRYARRIKAFVLISSTYNVAYLITEGVESAGFEPACRDDFLYESTSQRTNAKITDSNEICKVKEDYFCSPVGL